MYQLLKHHMNSNPEYLFGHACIAGMLATNDYKIRTYSGYEEQCNRQGIRSYSEECYNQFMIDCKRPLEVAPI